MSRLALRGRTGRLGVLLVFLQCIAPCSSWKLHLVTPGLGQIARLRPFSGASGSPAVQTSGLRALKASLDVPYLKNVANLAKEAIFPSAIPAASSFFLTRRVFLSGLGLIYSVAFMVALRQNKALLGEKGILPVKPYLDGWERSILGQKGVAPKEAGSWRERLRCFTELPTLFWFCARDRLDVWMGRFAGLGVLLSVLLMLKGTLPAVGAFTLWLLYLSIVNVGQTWYSFGWESQLLETGFLAVFLCPLWSLDAFKASNPVSMAVVWGYRWLLFRIMLGAGLIKLRGGEEWRDLTAMDYFYETQPVPSPLSYYMHQSPKPLHKGEVLTNHLVELVAPWLLLMPLRSLRLAGGVIQLVFQAVLISAGNLSFLNWLTALPAIWCLDDKFLAKTLPGLFKPSATLLHKLTKLRHHPPALLPMNGGACAWGVMRLCRDVALIVALAVLSKPVVQNLASPNQSMNRSFDRFHLVNTYGAFGSVTKQRYEVIVQGAVEYAGAETEWREYVFKVKPGPLTRRPPLITPYHYRLDWLAWFLPLGYGRSYPRWFVSFLAKLGENDRDVTALLGHNPFASGPPPKYLRAQLFQYTFSKHGSAEAKAGQWWVREEVGAFFPMRSAEDIRKMLS